MTEILKHFDKEGFAQEDDTENLPPTSLLIAVQVSISNRALNVHSNQYRCLWIP